MVNVVLKQDFHGIMTYISVCFSHKAVIWLQRTSEYNTAVWTSFMMLFFFFFLEPLVPIYSYYMEESSLDHLLNVSIGILQKEVSHIGFVNFIFWVNYPFKS